MWAPELKIWRGVYRPANLEESLSEYHKAVDKPQTHFITFLFYKEVKISRYVSFMPNVHNHAAYFQPQWNSLSSRSSTLISDSMADLQTYIDDVKTKLAPYTDEMAQRVHDDLQLLSNKLRVHMEEAKERITEYSQELQTMVEQNADGLNNKVNTYIHKLKKRLNKDTQEIKKWVFLTQIII